MALLPAVVRAAPYAAYVIDAQSGEVLYQQNAETRLHPASLTKMMTLYLTFQAIERGQISLDTKATISKRAAAEPPSRLGLKPGQKIAVRYLIRATALRSANDAATALAELVSGSVPAFADNMNRTAKQIGMTKTNFVNANGWTAQGHMSTARDMTILGRRLFYDYPQYYNIFSRRSSDAGIAEVANTNRQFLNTYKGADGIKTGFTNAAGFNLTASAERDGKRVIGTVMGGQSTAHRNAKMAELLDTGFRKAKPARKGAAPALLAAADAESPAARPGTAQARADEEAQRVAAAVASATAAVRSAQSLRETPAARTALARSERPRTRPAAPAALAQAADPALAGAIRENIAELVGEMQQREADAPSARLLIASAPPAARPGSMAFAALPPDAGPAAAASLLSAASLGTEIPAMAEPAPVAEAIAEPAAEGATAAPLHMAALAAPPPQRQAAARAAGAAPQPAALAPAPPEGPEIVTRLSTSGGRYWGINLGRFNSRYEAEKVLLRTALAEIGTLDGGLRKVVQRSGGFDATFMGLSQETADLACRRIQTRNQACFTIGP